MSKKKVEFPGTKKVQMPDGEVRAVIVPESDPEKREQADIDYKVQRYDEIAEWNFEIRMPKHLEEAGYTGGKGWGMNSWWFDIGDDGRIGYLNPDDMIEGAQDHFEEMQKRFASEKVN